MPPRRAATVLRPDDFSFFGFDGLDQQMAQTLGQLSIRHGEPTATVVEDAVFVPPIEMAERGHFEGALLTSAGKSIPTAVARRRFGAFGEQEIGKLSHRPEIKPERVVDEEVVYLGWHIGHFGHLLLETLARVWILEQIDPATKVLFHIERQHHLSGPTLRILEAFGVPLERILIIDQQTSLRRVIVPEPLYEIAHAAHELMTEPFRRVAATVCGDMASSDQPVYLSRRLLPSGKRRIVGEFEMEEVFRENGFLIAYPETMSFEEQVRVVNRHRDVFAAVGTAAYLTLFAMRPQKLHILTAGLPIPDYFLVPKASGADAWYCNCLVGENAPGLWYMPPVVNMNVLGDYLAAQGLLRNRLRVSVMARSLDLASDHGEARTYTRVRHHVVRGQLSDEEEAEALERARSSWPISWSLACYHAFRDLRCPGFLVEQFVELVSAEADANRLVYYHGDIEFRAGDVAAHCPQPIADLLATVLLDRFGMDISVGVERARRRLARQARTDRGARNGPRPRGRHGARNPIAVDEESGPRGGMAADSVRPR